MYSPQTEPVPCRQSAAVLYSLHLPAAVRAEIGHVRPQSIKSKLRAVTVCGMQLWLLCLPAAHHIRGCQHYQGPQPEGRGAGSLSGSSAGLRKARQARQLWTMAVPCLPRPGILI